MSHLTLRAGEIVRLLDMLRFYAAPFYKSTGQLFKLQAVIHDRLKARTGFSPLTEDELKGLQSVLHMVDHECEQLHLQRSLERLALFRNEYQTLNGTLIANSLTLDEAERELKEVQRCIRMDLFDPAFVHVPKEMEKYIDNAKLFDGEGVCVSAAFPAAEKDIVEAGNCYATGLYTACVFHLMRVVEIGARKMLSDLKARKHLPNPRRPVELCEWGDLTVAIDEAVKLLRVGSRTTMAKKNKFEFYNHAAAQFRNFKDAWRNNVSHSRRVYKQGGAGDVMDNTRQFMQHLSSNHKKSK